MERRLLRSLILVAAAALAAHGARAQEAAAEDNCVTCHGLEARQLARSPHARAGVTCIGCHGGIAGPMTTEEAHGSGLRPLSTGRAKVELCGGCHADQERMRPFGLRTDQMSLYWTSLHGQELREHDDPAVATCVSCHGSHGVLSPRDPRSSAHKFNLMETCGRCHSNQEVMQRYGLDPGIPDAYRHSVHGAALLDEGRIGSPGCMDCHGSHGATPPRVKDVGMVCGNCHTVVQRYFEESPHHEAALAGMLEECVSCHGNHAVGPPSADMLLGDEDGHCGSCHLDENDPARRVAQLLHADLARLDSEIEATEAMLRDAATRGLFIEEEHGYLDDARGLRVRARPLTHTLSPEALDDLMNRGQAMIGQTRESLEIKQRSLRDRKIFTGIFFGVVLVLVAVLLTYRRQI